MRKIKIGLLPLYIQLYDDTTPELRPRAEAFYNAVAGAMRGLGVEVMTAPVCRVKKEFADTVDKFFEGGAAGIATLHLAYSPSLEAIDSLCGSPLPILVLDITDTFSFGPGQETDEIMYNHGIHGAQDLCCMLTRRDRPYEIVAGHAGSGRVADAISAWANSAGCAASLHKVKAGIIGEPFAGMGDFQVPASIIKDRFGVSTVRYDEEQGRIDLEMLVQREIADEVSLLKEIFNCSAVDEEMLNKTAKTDLVIQKWIERENLGAFTASFPDVKRGIGLDMMPFAAASLAMSRGVGYAGEGDVLTSALVRSLAAVYDRASFTEMFCPDWEGGSVFLSHMGEMNIAMAAQKPRLLRKPFIYTDIGDTVSPAGLFLPGEAAIVNLAPTKNGGFRLIICKGDMLAVEGKDNFTDCIHGWFKPRKELGVFLEEYGRLGGTHHSALVYGASGAGLEYFGRMIGCETFVI